jgi:electron transfer flavoprotein alpha subunit
MGEVTEGRLWVFAEQRRGSLLEVGLELVGKAKELASLGGHWRVCAVLTGDGVEGLAEELLSCGADEVLLLDHPLLEHRCTQLHVKALEWAMGEARPDVLLMGGTALGVELAPRLAARLRTGLAAHCIDLELTPLGELVALVPWPVGNLIGRIGFKGGRPQMATVAPGVFPPPPRRKPTGSVVSLRPPLDGADIPYKVRAFKEQEAQRGGLEEAETVVAGGWGIGGKEGWALLEEFARVLNAKVGATRPPVDEGWADPQQMIGQSGKTVSPKLYIGVALSGHLHHMVGVKAKEIKVAINSDPNAPIFKHCDIGLVGDYREILPKLIEAIREISQAR